ncbi:hypothetical protein CCACVL1_15976 [Corchorus capsularis]|uniref:Uncharacterized protein n=1 Tax=Corchorus capsularis TaxID=210143 RepID=A0A1R3I078_COCAP|nr:hypothetical protein CCACVL1_15976 [Corchorus capsularis]
MDRQHHREQPNLATPEYEEVSSIEWEIIKVTEQEDLIYRMYRLVGERKDSGKESRGNREVLDYEK